MSIAIDEAEKKYVLPNNHGTPAFDLYWLKDQQQQSYVAGRTADPTEAEIDAAAFAQFKVANNNSSWTLIEEQYREAWDALPDMVSDDFRRKARIGLEAARKAVTE